MGAICSGEKIKIGHEQASIFSLLLDTLNPPKKHIYFPIKSFIFPHKAINIFFEQCKHR